MDLVETLLPGVGIRYEFVTARGRPLAVVVERDGAADICAYCADDPDQAEDHLILTREEAATVAELLGAPRVSQRLADLSHEVPGLHSARLTIEPGSRYDGRVLGDTKARTRTGCSIVAVVRGQDVITAPTPQDAVMAGDVLVAIGSAHGLEELAALVTG